MEVAVGAVAHRPPAAELDGRPAALGYVVRHRSGVLACREFGECHRVPLVSRSPSYYV